MSPDNKKPTGFMGSLWDTVSGFFKVGFGEVWTNSDKAVLLGWQLLQKELVKDWKEGSKAKWEGTLNAFIERKWIDAETKEELLKLSQLPYGGDIVSWYSMILLFVLKHSALWSDVIISDIKRTLNVQHRPTDASAGELINAAFLNPEKEQEIKDILAQLGLPDKQIELLFLSFHRAYDEGTIRTLYFREVITEPEVYEKMKAIGYNEERTAEIMQSWPVIPSLGDIVRYIAKEAFEPAMIEMFGLLEDYPVEAEKWAKKQGLDKRWVEAEWVAHWRDLGIDFMLEAYHRHIVDWYFVERYMALIEIPPALREIVKATAFNVFTRVDVRRMHKIGVLNDEELIISYQDQGYDEAKAIKMAEFTKRYNKEHERDLTKAEILKGYSERLIQHNEAKEMLIDMDYSDTESDYLLSYEDYKFEKKLQDKKLNNIQFRFVNNFISEPEARTRLIALALREEQIEVLIEEWRIDIFENQKFPSKTDLDKFFKGKVINAIIYQEEMFRLGYSKKYIGWYSKLIGIK